MNSLIVENFNLFHTLDSGQIFTFYPQQNYFYVIANNAVFKLKQEGNNLLYDGKTLNGSEITENDVKELFCLDEDQSIPILDPYVLASADAFAGMRIMKQNVYDTTLSFLISQMNNIPRITQLANVLLEHSSRVINFEGVNYKLMPLPEEIPTERELKDLKFGYRAKYISNLKHAKILLKDLENKDYEQAKKQLMDIPGVGSKVADCILLFSLKHYSAFPVDTHIIKMMKKAYKRQLENEFEKPIDKITQAQYERFGKKVYKEKAGIIQQYLFQYSRKYGN